MQKIRIESNKASVVIETNDSNVVKFFKESILPHVFIPSYKTSENIKGKNDFCFRFTEEGNAKSISVNPDNKICTIYDTWSKGIPTYVLSFLQLYLSTSLAEKSIITLHSSSVQGNANFIFLGHAGAGKTTVILDLISKLKYKYIANNKTLVSIKSKETLICGGTAAVTLRGDTLPSELKSMVKNVSITPYGRTAFIFKKEHVGLLNDNRKDFFIFLQINPGVSEFYKIEKDEAMIKLYPFFLDVVDHEIALFDYLKPVPTQFQASGKLKEKILFKMQDFIDSNKVFHLSGSLDFIREKVAFLNESAL